VQGVVHEMQKLAAAEVKEIEVPPTLQHLLQACR
jgi:hypothetical protein